MRVRRVLPCLVLVIGMAGCGPERSSPFDGLPIELPRAAHGVPFDGRDCVAIVIVLDACAGAGINAIAFRTPEWGRD